ncbi:hypothetical protein Y032_0037g3364 [Ancylostoma ceylanicum]|uniref:P2X purinoreceptor 7 intracellular domain-containing protein n=1 Tax=Ancylostoma ceylanicum TaxID=53326 RepID=A0A016UJU0_9BILA|nr:hypothetical protein Y032_0037g3364 [Ancylostoma ceylanicum]
MYLTAPRRVFSLTTRSSLLVEEGILLQCLRIVTLEREARRHQCLRPQKEGSDSSDGEGEVCPVAIGNPDSSYVLETYRRRNFCTSQDTSGDSLFCRWLNRRFEPSRSANTRWCTCGTCVAFPMARENVCCQELVDVNTSVHTEVFTRVSEKLKSVSGRCIVEHPSFQKFVLDKEGISLWIENKRFECGPKSSTSATMDEPRRYRYYAYRCFVLWAYGHVGLGKRLEIPACVRKAIMEAYPSQSGYVGFRESSSSTDVVDEEIWYNKDFC